LAVFAPATVVTAEASGFSIMRVLASDAHTDTVERLSALFGDFVATLDAMSGRWPLGQPALRALYSIAHRRIDLILYRPVAGPTGRHDSPLERPARPTCATLPLWVLQREVAISDQIKS
jgi:hypothetical protein